MLPALYHRPQTWGSTGGLGHTANMQRAAPKTGRRGDTERHPEASAAPYRPLLPSAVPNFPYCLSAVPWLPPTAPLLSLAALGCPPAVPPLSPAALGCPLLPPAVPQLPSLPLCRPLAVLPG